MNYTAFIKHRLEVDIDFLVAAAINATEYIGMKWKYLPPARYPNNYGPTWQAKVDGVYIELEQNIRTGKASVRVFDAKKGGLIGELFEGTMRTSELLAVVSGQEIREHTMSLVIKATNKLHNLLRKHHRWGSLS